MPETEKPIGITYLVEYTCDDCGGVVDFDFTRDMRNYPNCARHKCRSCKKIYFFKKEYPCKITKEK